MLRCVSMTPLGKPVVPEVYCIITQSFWSNWLSISANSFFIVYLPSSRSSGTL